MSNTTRHKRRARRNRGPVALAKRVARRDDAPSKCNLCGRACRPEKLSAGLCPVCNPPRPTPGLDYLDELIHYRPGQLAELVAEAAGRVAWAGECSIPGWPVAPLTNAPPNP